MNNIVIDHKLKVLPEFYDDVESGLKPFEVRIDDREPRYAVGDQLQLQEWNWKYTGRECFKKATYILRDERFCMPGHCIIGLTALRAAQEKPLTLKELRAIEEPTRLWIVDLWGEMEAHYELVNWETLCACPLIRKLHCISLDGYEDYVTDENYGKTWLAYRSRPKEDTQDG